jgi:hypothetical protein
MTRRPSYMSIRFTALEGVKPFGVCRTAAGMTEVRET